MPRPSRFFSGGTGASGADGPGPDRGARVAVAITSIAEKIVWHMETLRNWVRQAERDQGTRPGLTTKERQRLKQLERDNFELRRANEILRLASAYFAKREVDRRRM